MTYIEDTKARFSERASRLAEVIDFPTPLEYRELSEGEQNAYEKFLNDRISDDHRKALFKILLKDLEEVRLKLVEAEKNAFAEWEKLPKEEKEQKAAMVEGEIYGTKVSASRLGVVLDDSPSMRPYLEAVRGEISKSFPDAHYREAAGSGLQVKQFYSKGQRKTPDDSWFYAEIPIGKVNPFDPKWHQAEIFDSVEPHYRQISLERSPLSALIALVKLQEVDSLYWFCDFEDDIDSAVLKFFGEMIQSKEVKLFVHTSRRRPDKDLVEIVEASGGEVIRERIR